MPIQCNVNTCIVEKASARLVGQYSCRQHLDMFASLEFPSVEIEICGELSYLLAVLPPRRALMYGTGSRHRKMRAVARFKPEHVIEIVDFGASADACVCQKIFNCQRAS